LTYNKISFLKIKDPSKRDKLVAEYIKIKDKIQNDFRSERSGEQSIYDDFGKIFKQITEQQQKSSEEIVSKFAPLQEAIENMPALSWGVSQPELEGQPEGEGPPRPSALPAPDGEPCRKVFDKIDRQKSEGRRNIWAKRRNRKFETR